MRLDGGADVPGGVAGADLGADGPDIAFDEALVEARQQLGRTYPMIINGKERTAAKTFDATSPVDRSLVTGHHNVAGRGFQ